MPKIKPKMKIVYRKISTLIPAEYNPRKMTDKERKDLIDSIKNLGTLEPAVINMYPGRENIIISGHQRLDVSQSLGMDEYPCYEVSFPPEKEKEANIRMNKNTGSWDLDVLTAEFDKQDLIDWGFEEIDFPEADKTVFNTDEDDVPEPPKQAKTKPGNLYQLGNHRLLCGDSTNIEHVERLMHGQKADMVFTDPPYNIASDSINFSENVSKSMKKLKESEWDKGYKPKKFIGLIPLIIEKGTVYIWTSHFLFGEGIKLLSEVCDFTNYCIWSKPNPMPSLSKLHPTWNTEMCLYGSLGKKRIVNFPADGHFLSCKEVIKKTDGTHPTQKPIELIEPFLKFNSNPGSGIFDFFGGSGSTLIACEKTNRKCYMMELDPIYCDVIVKRWEDFTGKKAVLI